MKLQLLVWGLVIVGIVGAADFTGALIALLITRYPSDLLQAGMLSGIGLMILAQHLFWTVERFLKKSVP
jgi:hypothetical protein